MDGTGIDMTGRAELAVLTTRQMAAADRIAIAAGTSGIVLMERAGHARTSPTLIADRDLGSDMIVAGPNEHGAKAVISRASRRAKLLLLDRAFCKIVLI